MESDDDYDYEMYLLPIQDPPPERPSKMNPVSSETHKKCIKERKNKGNKRFDKKTKAATKRSGYDC